MIVSWNTTNACNLYCRHCYRDAGERAGGELSTEEGVSLIEQVAGQGFKIMIFSGGEPLLREDILYLVEHAGKLGMRPVFGTNGTLITGELARKLKRAGASVMGISLDSTNPKSHDDFRSTPGAWKAAVEGMRACREAGLPFQVHTTVMKWNWRELERITDLAVSLGAVAHHIFFLVPTGRAVDIEKDTLKEEQYEELLRRIIIKQQEVPIELKPTCAPQFMRIAVQMGVKTRYTKGCLAGISYCIITPRGFVQPCAYLEIQAGNIREQLFAEIWKNTEVFRILRTEEYSGACGTCAFKKICGGCRARAYFYYGNYMAEEPWCLYRGGR